VTKELIANTDHTFTTTWGRRAAARPPCPFEFIEPGIVLAIDDQNLCAARRAGDCARCCMHS
jgi:hypothetical protein